MILEFRTVNAYRLVMPRIEAADVGATAAGPEALRIYPVPGPVNRIPDMGSAQGAELRA